MSNALFALGFLVRAFSINSLPYQVATKGSPLRLSWYGTSGATLSV